MKLDLKGEEDQDGPKGNENNVKEIVRDKSIEIENS